MIRAVLVDDEPPARVRMRQLLDAVGDVSVVGEAGNADEARSVIRDTRPDLLFLDDLANHLLAVDPHAEVRHARPLWHRKRV